jgi:hypothetical protein
MPHDFVLPYRSQGGAYRTASAASTTGAPTPRYSERSLGKFVAVKLSEFSANEVQVEPEGAGYD